MLKFIFKIFPFLQEWLEKELEKYLQKKFDEQTDVRKQMYTLKEILVKEVAEKQFYKAEVNRVKHSEKATAIRMMETLIDITATTTIKKLKEHFLFVPKGVKMSPYAGLLSSSLEEKISQKPISNDI